MNAIPLGSESIETLCINNEPYGTDRWNKLYYIIKIIILLWKYLYNEFAIDILDRVLYYNLWYISIGE